MAISKDGFIADTHDDTPWSDAAWESFAEFVRSCDIVLLGRRTFEIMREADEFVEGPQYIVVTQDAAYDTGGYDTVDIRQPEDVPVAPRVGIIGGGDLNGRLAELGVIDEIILDIEPIELKQGIRLFGKHDVPLKLQPLGSRPLGDGTVQRHYRVVHNA